MELAWTGLILLMLHKLGVLLPFGILAHILKVINLNLKALLFVVKGLLELKTLHLSLWLQDINFLVEPSFHLKPLVVLSLNLTLKRLSVLNLYGESFSQVLNFRITLLWKLTEFLIETFISLIGFINGSLVGFFDSNLVLLKTALSLAFFTRSGLS